MSSSSNPYSMPTVLGETPILAGKRTMFVRVLMGVAVLILLSWFGVNFYSYLYESAGPLSARTYCILLTGVLGAAIAGLVRPSARWDVALVIWTVAASYLAVTSVILNFSFARFNVPLTLESLRPGIAEESVWFWVFLHAFLGLAVIAAALLQVSRYVVGQSHS